MLLAKLRYDTYNMAGLSVICMQLRHLNLMNHRSHPFDNLSRLPADYLDHVTLKCYSVHAGSRNMAQGGLDSTCASSTTSRQGLLEQVGDAR